MGGYDEYDEGRVEEAMDRDEADCRWGWDVESGVQHGPIRADGAIAVGVVPPGGRKGLRGRTTNSPKGRKAKPDQNVLGPTKVNNTRSTGSVDRT